MVWTAATAWSDAANQAGTLHLVVLRGHLLTPTQLERLTAVHSAVDMQLTVVWHARIPSRADLFGRTGYRIVDDLDDVFGPTRRLAIGSTDHRQLSRGSITAARGPDARPKPISQRT